MNTAQKTLQLTPTQIEVAKRFGLTPTQYAEQYLAELMKENWPTVEEVDKDEDLIDGNDPNNIEILNAPIATLKNMWLVKFGYRWIEDEDPVLDDVWEDIRARLENYGLLEERNYWYKLKEDL